jgi:hypothetical protein
VIRVRVSCVDCGVQRLRPSQVQLFTTPQVYESRYAFTCQMCGSWINRPCPPRLVSDLRQAQVPEQRERVPREVFEPHRGPSIAVDEVLDFVLELAAVDDVARFACRP